MSNFTATLFPIPSYPRPTPPAPSAVAAPFCITNVIPSAAALVIWKLKFVVKLCTFTGVL